MCCTAKSYQPILKETQTYNPRHPSGRKQAESRAQSPRRLQSPMPILSMARESNWKARTWQRAGPRVLQNNGQGNCTPTAKGTPLFLGTWAVNQCVLRLPAPPFCALFVSCGWLVFPMYGFLDQEEPDPEPAEKFSWSRTYTVVSTLKGWGQEDTHLRSFCDS